jgi:hypothetical protein
MRSFAHTCQLLAILCVCSNALATPLAAPGDMRLRHDLQLLNDAGVINIPMTAWPISLGDVHNAVGAANLSDVSDSTGQMRHGHDHLGRGGQ